MIKLQNLNEKLFQWNPSLAKIYFIQSLSIIIYWTFIWYFDKIYPGEYGIKLKWNFPFNKEYWKSREIRNSTESFSSLSSEDELIVEIKDLIKYYPESNRVALNKISFNLYENEINCLVGHNGAGKTTLMNILCGIIEQTSGEILILNNDTRYSMEYLHKIISYCPQHDILFDYLTVKEQIEFHCICRGYSKTKEEISFDLLQSVNLINSQNILCMNLSGGMKRRLAIACAFIGDSKLVLLDEPSSGLDPINRYLLWDWIRSMKENRTILLSTHFLEEADCLGDKIIILSNGKIIANDSPSQLKVDYGNGYKFILNKNKDFEDLNLFEMIEKSFPNCKKESETKNQLIIETNQQKLSNSLFRS